MSFWSRYGTIALIIGVCAALDVAGRIALDFDMILVSAMEAMLFGAGAAALVWAADRQEVDEKIRGTALVIAVLFALAALRAALWAGFGNVFLANMAVLAAGIVVALGFWRFRRNRAAQ